MLLERGMRVIGGCWDKIKEMVRGWWREWGEELASQRALPHCGTQMSTLPHCGATCEAL